MRRPSDLRILTLTVLQQPLGEKITRYQVMININHIIDGILPPYSPGAVYHELRTLQRDRLINITHDAYVNITEHGIKYLYEILLETPTPTPLLSLLVRTLALILLDDISHKTIGIHKLQIETIKYNHIMSTELGANYRAPYTELSKLALHLKKAISSFIARL